MAAGEHSGHLDLVLARLADYSESAHASRQKVKMALLYPSLLLLVAIGIVAGLMTFVVPEVVEVITGQGQELPLLTRGLIGLSAFVSQVVPTMDALSSVILLIGMAVGVDYSLFYVRRAREERAKGATRHDAILTGLAQLPERQGHVLAAALDDLPAEDIALLLQIGVDDVRTAADAGALALRRHLDGREVQEAYDDPVAALRQE